MDCIFCKIIAGDIPAKIIYQNDDVIAFADMHPAAPFHFLVIPKRHIATLNDLTTADREVMGTLPLVAAQLAATHGFADSGFRVVMNCNADAGQSVFHIHMHVLGGRSLSWPPG